MTEVSRGFLLLTIFLLFTVELLFAFLLSPHVPDGNSVEEIFGEQKKFKDLVRIKYLLPSAIWLFILFFFMVWLKTSHVYYYPRLEHILLILFGSWILATFITFKFGQNNHRNVYYYVAPYLKSGILMLLFISIFYYFLRLEPLSHFLLFGTAIVHVTLESLIFTIIFLVKYVDSPDRAKELITYTRNTDNKLNKSHQSARSKTNAYTLEDIIKEALPLESDHLKLLLPEEILHRTYGKHEICLLETESVFNIEVLEADRYTLLINLRELNSMRRINRYLLSTHNKIVPGGWIVGNYTALEDDWLRLRSKMPKLIFSILYPVYFSLHRVIPKVPYLKSIYFTLTHGKNRKLSRAEVLGRLAYCGYQIVNEYKDNNRSNFIAQKTYTPSIKQNPSYGPFIKLDRIGYRGEHIIIYKLRTMHPYSEFIQKDIYEQNALNESGKLKDDFRITKWGKAFRKIWLDEFPQLINWLRGDISIVGVRALSEHYFSLYPSDLQNLRIKFKPGLIPPYYADLPRNFEEIIESERTYLLLKQDQPLRTDFKYFWKAFFNIVIKGARSQ
ncbi:MAG: sugar transferase [Candidatus Marinimicrobia bacterium]|nr:sugar transferase [Candidatus Neomarinimicrobiota bacterium]